MWEWTGWLAAAVSAAVAYANRRDAIKFRRLDNPWVDPEHQDLSHDRGYRIVHTHIANDEQRRYVIDELRIVSPGTARLSRAIPCTVDDGYGGTKFTFKPSKWSQSVMLEEHQSAFLVKPPTDQVKVLVVMRARTDPTNKPEYVMTLRANR